MKGPTNGPQRFASSGWDVRKNDFQKLLGTSTPSAPAISRPPTTSGAGGNAPVGWLSVVFSVLHVPEFAHRLL
jgi:hypothetical protein